MFELNGEIYYKVFECGKIPSYMDPAKKYNEDYIYQVAKNYDPVNVHEAPFWVGHPEYHTEPRAGGWIKKVLAVGKELYVSFSEVFPWMKELFNSGEFKKCSVEMGDLEVNSDGTAIPYLWALGATNIPAVKGLPALRFDGDKFDESKIKNKVCFSFLNFDYKNSENKNNTEMDALKKLAGSLNISLSGKETESEITGLIEKKTSELQASESAATKSLEDSKNESAAKLVDQAIEDGQIKPADREEFLNFAKQNFSSCEKVIASLPKKDLNVQSGVGKGRVRSESKDLSGLTYEDVIRNPEKFIGVLAEADIMKLKEQSAAFKDTKLD